MEAWAAAPRAFSKTSSTSSSSHEGPGRISRHLNQRVSRVTSRLDDHKVLLGLIVAVVGAFLAYVAFVSTTGPPFQSKYKVEVQVPGDAPVLREGQAVRIGGKLAGLVSDVEPDRENHGTIVTANITKPEFRPIGSDATANVRVHSIVYQTYLELYPGDPGPMQWRTAARSRRPASPPASTCSRSSSSSTRRRAIAARDRRQYRLRRRPTAATS